MVREPFKDHFETSINSTCLNISISSSVQIHQDYSKYAAAYTAAKKEETNGSFNTTDELLRLFNVSLFIISSKPTSAVIHV